MDGILNVHKPVGPTSHDIVDIVRRAAGQKKVGHAGTLDPMASGVLVVCLGSATRVVRYLMGAPKEYRAKMALGVSTDTQDAAGRVLREADASNLTREDLEAAAGAFVGEIQQVPPMVSAIKHQGRPLYKIAREGGTVERAPRAVTIHSLHVTDFVPGVHPEAEIEVSCSSGTYIRTLCADIGDSLGCGAHMAALERTGVGRYQLHDSISLDQMEQAAARGELDGLLVGIADALSDMPAVTVDHEDVDNALHGLPVRASGPDPGDGTVRIISEDNLLIGLGTVTARGDRLVVKPHTVLADSALPSARGSSGSASQVSR